MSTTNTDFKNTYFQHPSLTPVRGEPTYESLTRMYREIKANANSVPTTLGGGNNGHLGLVVSQETYQRIAPNTPFVRPVNPGVLGLLPNATQYQIAQQTATHNRNLKAFVECNLLERTLIQQIKEAIEADYLEGKLNIDTGLIEGNISEIMAYLFDTYGHISPTLLHDKREELLNTSYNTAKPIDILFNDVSKYASVAEAAGNPETPEQLISIALIILTRTGAFSHDIRTWHAKNQNEKTWPTFKAHFKEAQRLARMSGGTINQLGLHEANVMVDKIVDGLKYEYQNETNQNEVAEAQMQKQIDYMANVARQNESLATKVQEMMAQMVQLQTQLNTMSKKKPYKPDPNGGRETNKNYKHYCWTHGSCSHDGKSCKKKAPEHQDGATFTNMMGGSTKGCFWL